MKRRQVLQAGMAALALPLAAGPVRAHGLPQVHYLEIVTPQVDAVCALYSQVHGLAFGEPVADLGGARTAELACGGRLGIRPPLRPSEPPVVRPYLRVDDIQASVAAAVKAGAKVAVPPMRLGSHGQCAIVLQGGIEAGFWQV